MLKIAATIARQPGKPQKEEQAPDDAEDAMAHLQGFLNLDRSIDSPSSQIEDQEDQSPGSPAKGRQGRLLDEVDKIRSMNIVEELLYKDNDKRKMNFAIPRMIDK